MNKAQAMGLGATALGSAMINKELKKGNLTGRERVYHNTDKKNVSAIQDTGILASKALDPNNLTHAASGDFLKDEDMAGLTYVARKRTPALGVAMASANRQIKDKSDENYMNPLGAYSSRKTLKADIPTWKMDTVENPELEGAKSQRELNKVLTGRWKGRADKRFGNSISNKLIISPTMSLSAKALSGSVYNQLGPNGTHVIKGDIAPEFVKGSDKYKNVTYDEFREYARLNPDRFLGGLGRAAGGAALALGGGLAAAKPLLKKASEEEVEKQAGIKTNIAKGALGAGLAAGASNALIGKKTLYQGTSNEAWDNIKKDGLRANYGGSGASKSVGNSAYQKNSESKIHLTAMRPVANIYASVNTPEIKAKKEEVQAFKDRVFNVRVSQGDPGKSVVDYKLKRGHHRDKLEKIRGMEEELKAMNLLQTSNPINTIVSPRILTDGRTLKVKMNYDKWKNDMEQDREGVMYKKYINKLRGGNNPIIKNMAARGNIDVPIEEIAGSDASMSDRMKHTISGLPGYVKNNPLRFATGVASTGLGAGMMASAVKGALR